MVRRSLHSVAPALLVLLFGIAITLPHRTMGWRKFETVGMIPQQHFEQNTVLYGYTERIIDGDTIRVRHLPMYSVSLPGMRRLEPLAKRGIAGEALSIRIYGVDCPELAKTKHQVSQPFGEEAKQFTSDLCLHRVVRITLLRKDQYGRAVCAVEAVPRYCAWFRSRKDISMELAHAGLAELYTGGGAEYWNRRDQLQAAVDRAKTKRMGLWSQSQYVSAADHKRLQKERAASGTAPKSKQKSKQSTPTRTPLQPRRHSRAPTSRENQKATQASTGNPKRQKLLEAAMTGLELAG